MFWFAVSLASGMTCDDVRGLVDVQIPREIAARTLRQSGDLDRLVATCPEAVALVARPRRVRRVRADLPAPAPVPHPYRSLPGWVRPGLEIVPAGPPHPRAEWG